MSRQVKCPQCEKYFSREKEDYVVHKKRHYHKACYDLIEQEDKDKENLNKYIMNMFGLDYVSPKISKQIKEYVTTYKYTYSGIHGSLVYFFEIKKGDLRKTNGGIGIVPYIYNDAKEYFQELRNIEEKNQDKDYNNQRIKIVIKPPTRKPISKVKEIDWGEIDE